MADSRDPDPARKGIFQTHNCYRCRHGEKPCVQGWPNRWDDNPWVVALTFEIHKGNIDA